MILIMRWLLCIVHPLSRLSRLLSKDQRKFKQSQSEQYPEIKNVHRADMRTYYYTEGWHNQLKEIVGEHQLEHFELQHLLITEQDAVCNVTLIDTIRKRCP
ncbi:hypothetical protein T12_6827 [Trichinella patagoniensis]|uniref:Uncharacterized protein n=1 Tax=Trichinella patagoniensis TaxID=990121 RepID=A0A0V1A7F0_9BILA|nr:hypothetical protein T12_6827 [Trichinella patagoniensis]